MWVLVLKDLKSGAEATAPLNGEVLTVGRDETNDVVLEFPEIAEHQCEIENTPRGVVVRDYGDGAGTFLDRKRIRNEAMWKPGEELRIGSCVVTLHPDGTTPIAVPAAAPQVPSVPKPAPHRRELPIQAPAAKNSLSPKQESMPAPQAVVEPPPTCQAAAPTPAPAVRGESDRRATAYKAKIREYLVDHPEVKRLIHISAADDEVRTTLRRLIREATGSVGVSAPPGLSEASLEKEMIDEILGLGPLEDLMKDDSVQEVMVNRWDRILVEKTMGGGIALTGRSFLDEDHLLETVRRMLAPLGRHLNETTPLVDARLKDGTRLNAVVPPIAIGGCVVTMRKFSKEPFTLDRLQKLGSITPEVAEILRYAVRARLNLMVSGGTGTGKTCFLNALAGLVPVAERMVIVEDTHELRIEHGNTVYLESRPANLEGKGEIPIRRLVINALRMRPDRIIVGECRGDETFDMLQAMNTGHLGSMTTVHANSPRDAVLRVENMTLMAGYELPAAAIRKQVTSAIHVMIQLSRLGGKRRVSCISEITGIEGQTVTMQDIYTLDEEGRLVPTGAVPTFLMGLRQDQRSQLLGRFGIGR